MSEVNSEHFSEENPAVSTENITEQPLAAAEKPPVSERKLAANRSNSAKSTGPKSSRGKAISRANAIRHGLLASEIIIASRDGRGRNQEATKLLAELRKHFQPCGIMEDLLVQRIAASFWGQKMTLRAMNGGTTNRGKWLDFPVSWADLLIRYDAQHSRELYRALSELERLQGRRLDEEVPAPIKVGVTGGG